ncbi:23S rRNA (adenine(2030)-N(6))-methyltransferase RlmJ [Zoogloeaceae bacterium G21618-S1]|nr:23S rRNA (adenine(2030)-N(6))-methyltransferase RlmJ [Zoogloeaceae bacterium G21618-S1]
MLSYRHAYHAGNHADVLKHLTLVLTLDYFNQKPAPYWYIDTHAGPGSYRLDQGPAARTGEFETGIGRIVGIKPRPKSIQRFLETVGCLGKTGLPASYPGSPDIAQRLLRDEDRLRLFELHPTDFDALDRHFAHSGRKAQVKKTDGFVALKALLPPPTRRAVVLIDPPYEVKQDYDTLMATLEDGLKRFPTGCYLVWYPIIGRPESRRLPKKLLKLGASTQSWLHATLEVASPAADGLGMTGSGMFVLNPPWTLAQQLAEALPWLSQHMGEGAPARYQLDSHSE